MNNTRQEVASSHDRDKALEAQINLCKGWWRAGSKSEMRAGFHILVNLIAERSPQQIRKLEINKFGGAM